MKSTKLPRPKQKQKINTKGLSDLANQVKEILIKEEEHAQKEMRNGSNNLSKLNYIS